MQVHGRPGCGGVAVVLRLVPVSQVRLEQLRVQHRRALDVLHRLGDRRGRPVIGGRRVEVRADLRAQVPCTANVHNSAAGVPEEVDARVVGDVGGKRQLHREVARLGYAAQAGRLAGCGDAPLGEFRDHCEEDLGRGNGIGECAVVGDLLHTVERGEFSQVVAPDLGMQLTCQA